MHPNLEILEIVVQGLEAILDEVYFVGGASTLLYLDQGYTDKIRATEDVDCVVEIQNYLNYRNVEKKLEDLGFAHSMAKSAPICRWIYQGILVDVMPSDPTVLGFSNQWYIPAIKNFINVSLPSGKTIKIFSPPYFLATKIEAFLDRGKGDFFGSKDLEDVVTLIHGRKNIRLEVIGAPEDVKNYIAAQLGALAENELFVESTMGHLADQKKPEEAARRVLDFIRSLPPTRLR